MNFSAFLVLLASKFHLASSSPPRMRALAHSQQQDPTSTVATITSTAIASPPTATYLYVNTTTPQTLCNVSETGARRRRRGRAHRPNGNPSPPPQPPPPEAAAAAPGPLQNRYGVGILDGDERGVVASRRGGDTTNLLADCAALAAAYVSHDGYWAVTASGPGRPGWQYFAQGSCSFGLSPEFSAGGPSGALWIGNHDIAVMINDLMQSNQNGPPWTPVWQLSGLMSCSQRGKPAASIALNWTVFIDGSV